MDALHKVDLATTIVLIYIPNTQIFGWNYTWQNGLQPAAKMHWQNVNLAFGRSQKS